MKSLEIPNGQSESAYPKRTENTMAKRKKYKKTNNDPHEPLKTGSELWCYGRESSSFPTSAPHCQYIVFFSNMSTYVIYIHGMCLQ